MNSLGSTKRKTGLHGWQMVPIEAVSEMKTELVYRSGVEFHQAQALWSKLLEHAPLPPEESLEAVLLHAKADSMSEISAFCRSVAGAYSRQGFSEMAAAVDTVAREAITRSKTLRMQACGELDVHHEPKEEL